MAATDWPGSSASFQPRTRSIVEQLRVAGNVARSRREAAGLRLQQRNDDIVERRRAHVGRLVDEGLLGIGRKADIAARAGPRRRRRLAEHLARIGAASTSTLIWSSRMDVVVRSAAGREIDPQHHHQIVAEHRPVIGGLLDRHRRPFALRQSWLGARDGADNERGCNQVAHEFPL